jgi:hypothetical protein
MIRGELERVEHFNAIEIGIGVGRRRGYNIIYMVGMSLCPLTRQLQRSRRLRKNVSQQKSLQVLWLRGLLQRRNCRRRVRSEHTRLRIFDVSTRRSSASSGSSQRKAIVTEYTVVV